MKGDQWEPADQEPEIERLVRAHRLEEPAWLSYADSTAAAAEVRKAQDAVDRIRNRISRR
jgi:hypothetical protein